MVSEAAVEIRNDSTPRPRADGYIMVVDDNPNNLRLLEKMLRDCGFAVRLFPKGELALAAAAATPPDLILLDIMMPGLDGYAVCRALKAEGALSDIPVIFLSALDDTGDKVKAFQSGGVDYITKPFQLEEVRARIETHLELRRHRRLLQENYENLRRLETLRDGLVHMIVHDMRSPLTVIHGSLELFLRLEEGGLSERGAARLHGAMKRADELVGMVNSLLDVSKLESGKMELALAEFDIAALVRRVAQGVADASPKYASQTIFPETAIYVRADGELIRRVLQNLADNAVKYSPEGTEIRFDIQHAGGAVRVSVEDNGPGIPPEYNRLIFDKFFQVGRRKHSTGLGLAFCKLAVEAHGGVIGVDSEVGVGSKFWFILPAPGAATN